jgi:hypothetical protein
MTLASLPHGDIHDFDFLVGRWRVHNRRLVSRLRGADQWTEFEGLNTCEPRLNGGANIDQIDFPSLGWSGLTLRTSMWRSGAGRSTGSTAATAR